LVDYVSVLIQSVNLIFNAEMHSDRLW